MHAGYAVLREPVRAYPLALANPWGQAEDARIRAGGSSFAAACRSCGVRVPKGQGFCRTCRPAVAPRPQLILCRACGQAKPIGALNCDVCGAEDEGPAYAAWTQQRKNPGWLGRQECSVDESPWQQNPFFSPPAVQYVSTWNRPQTQRVANPFDPGYAAYPLSTFENAGPVDLNRGAFHGMPNPVRSIFLPPNDAEPLVWAIHSMGYSAMSQYGSDGVVEVLTDAPNTVTEPILRRMTNRRVPNPPLALISNPPRSKKCQLGMHDWDESGQCTRKGCDAYYHAGQATIFGVDPTIAGETQRRIAATGQDELFGTGGEVRTNPRGRTLEDSAEEWARGLGLAVPPRGSPAFRGLMAAWQRAAASRNPAGYAPYYDPLQGYDAHVQQQVRSGVQRRQRSAVTKCRVARRKAKEACRGKPGRVLAAQKASRASAKARKKRRR